MMEIDDKLAYRLHGLDTSESDSDSDNTREFDEEYESIKPPPYDYELIRDRIVLISAPKTPVVNVWQNPARNTWDNNKKENGTKIIEVVSNFTLATNNIIPTGLNETGNDVVQNFKKKTKRDNRFLQRYKRDTTSRKKEKHKKSMNKIDDTRANEMHQGKCLYMNIQAGAQLEKEFPSLDELYKNNFKRDNTKKAEAATSRIVLSKKKKKQFKPVAIDVHFPEDIPVNGYGTKKSKKKIKLNFDDMDLEYDIPVRKIRNNKGKTKNTAKQPMKRSLNTTIVDTSNIKDTNVDFEDVKVSTGKRYTGTIKKSNSLVKKCFQNNSKYDTIKVVVDYTEAVTETQGKLDLEEEKTDREHALFTNFEQSPVELCINSNEKLNKEPNQIVETRVAIAMQHKDDPNNTLNIQKINIHCDVSNNIQEQVSSSAGHENNLMNIDSEPTFGCENNFPEEFREFLQNIVYESATITDLSSFTYEQLHLAYTAYEKKHRKDSSYKDDNIVGSQSSQKKTPDGNEKCDQKKEPDEKKKSNQKKKPDQKKKLGKKEKSNKISAKTEKSVIKSNQQQSSYYRNFDTSSCFDLYLDNSYMNSYMNLGTVYNNPSLKTEENLCDQVKCYMEDVLHKYRKTPFTQIYLEFYIDYVYYVNMNCNFLKDKNVIGYLPEVNINTYLGMQSLTYISKIKLKL